MKVKSVPLLVLMLIVSWTGLTAQTPDRAEILDSLDRQSSYRDTDFSAEYTIVSEKPGQERSVFQVRSFRRDSSDSFVMVILEPRVRRGEGYLQLGETAWSYDPESREFGVFSMKENFQDSEARNSDFSSLTVSESYEITDIQQARLGSFDVYLLDLKALNDRVTFPRIRFWVRQDNYLVLKEEMYSLSGRLMRTGLITSYARVSGRFVPTKILYVDNLNQGERTEITARNISFQDIPDSVFTRSYLERIGR